MTPAEERNMQKLRDDRDLALRITKETADKLRLLAEHVGIKGGRLVILRPGLTKAEVKALSDSLEVKE